MKNCNNKQKNHCQKNTRDNGQGRKNTRQKDREQTLERLIYDNFVLWLKLGTLGISMNYLIFVFRSFLIK